MPNVGRLNFLAADHHKAKLCRMVTEHQASAHAEATDGAVVFHIDLWRFDVVFLQASLNAVKSKLPSSVRKASFNAGANPSPQEFTSPRLAYTDLAFCRALIEASAASCSLRRLRMEALLLLFVSSCVSLGLQKERV